MQYMPEQEVTEEDLKDMSPEQLAELQKQNCLFCHLASGKVPSKIVYEDNICFAILDINPASKGHMLLMPKEHYVMFPQTPEDVIKHLAKTAKMLSRTAIAALSAEGTNIFIANGPVAGQKAPHLIIHIIPRFPDDGITCFELPETDIKDEEITGTQKILAHGLGTVLEKVEEKPKGPEEITLKELEKALR